jgi:hypothetical protein
MSALFSVLHRLGVVRQLTALWRRDLEASDARAVARVAKADEHRRAAQVALKSLEREQRIATRQATESAAAIQALAADVTQLTDAVRKLEGHTRALEQVIDRDRRQGAALEAFRRSVTDDTVARHVAASMCAAPMFDDPAPMLVVDRLLPDEIYATFLDAIPPEAAFTVKDRTKADYRAQKPRAAIPALSADVWRYLDDELIPRTIVPAIAQRFGGFVGEYYRELLGADIGARVAALPLAATDARLMLRRPGYHLEPHLDPKRVLLTGLLYFARPGDSEQYGTSFYRVDGQVIRDHASTYYPVASGHRCDLVRTVPFRPNSGVVFLNSVAHGADLPTDLPKTTERYALQFYVGPPIDALREILRTLPAPARDAWSDLLG